MSLARQFFREFRPLFRMLEEPIGHQGPPSFYGMGSPLARSSLFDGFNSLGRPAIDVSEGRDKYILEAELPGVKKENIEVRIGDSGRSVTIEGKVVERRGIADPDTAAPAQTSGNAAETSKDSMSTAITQPAEEAENQISTERTFVGNTTFSRTVFLPRLVDPQNVKANLDHGILTITINKAEDKASAVVPIE